MSIVIDTNVLASVLNEECSQHADFAPVKKWIEKGKGFILFGGATYRAELVKSRFGRLAIEMRKVGRAILIKDCEVDKREIIVRSLTKGSACNDQHIIALLGTARCSLLCSLDKESYEFVKDLALYPTGMKKVRIYKSSRNANLLKKCKKDDLRNVV